MATNTRREMKVLGRDWLQVPITPPPEGAYPPIRVLTDSSDSSGKLILAGTLALRPAFGTSYVPGRINTDDYQDIDRSRARGGVFVLNVPLISDPGLGLIRSRKWRILRRIRVAAIEDVRAVPRVRQP